MPRATTCDHICWHPGCDGVFRAEVGEALAGAARHASASGHPQADYGLLRKSYVPVDHPLTCLFGACNRTFPARFGAEVKAAARHARKAGHPNSAFIRGPHPDRRVPAPVAPKAAKAAASHAIVGWLVIALHVIAFVSLIAGFITAGQFVGFMAFGLISSAASMGGRHHGAPAARGELSSPAVGGSPATRP
ncbi:MULTISPECIES: hypothetical protein [unclassified Streptomyces]|uniref:hypothetical protein n=1 Tax=unclassified Streptomyces TaxID=2593676 RepID=UPI002E10EEAC|nr:hypothetical protein OG457_46680 [Streptomyces sp. NBC_01207]WTA16812.1 hypothetical protein OG365_01380 [Streptomyces sp. NBC_00853]